MASADWHDVRFDYDGSIAMARRLWQLAERLQTLSSERLSWAEEALVHWQGPKADEFADRINTEIGDLDRGEQEVRSGAVLWAEAWARAINVQNRRLWAREAHRRKQERSFWQKSVDHFNGFDDFPPDPPEYGPPQPPHFTPPGGIVTY